MNLNLKNLNLKNILKSYVKITYIKYLLSYMVIFTILIVGFFLIVKSQLSKNYFNHLVEQEKMNLDRIANQLENELLFLSQVDRILSSDIDLVMGRHKTEDFYRNEAMVELDEYDSTIRLINSIIFLAKENNCPLATATVVTYNNGIFHITDQSLKNVIAFDPTPYLNTAAGQLIYIFDEYQQHLIYFPPTNSKGSYICFYLLDTDEMHKQFENLISTEMPAIAMVDANNQVVVGINHQVITSYIGSQQLTDGVCRLDSSITLLTRTGINKNFSIVALLSNDFLLNQINATFASSYLSLMGLSVLGFLLVLLAMRVTYLPFHRAINEIIPNPDPSQSYVKQLGTAFFEKDTQSKELMQKLDNYRRSIESALLDSMISTKSVKDIANISEFDQFFDQSSYKKIFVLRLSAPSTFPSSWETILEYYQNALPGNDTCIMLESLENRATFLINYVGAVENKEERLWELSTKLYEEQGFLSAISEGADSPMDIPSLCESTLRASSHWPDIPVVDYKAIPPTTDTYTYPHDQLAQLSALLDKNNFPQAQAVMDSLFQMISHYITQTSSLPNFFISCVLVDVLTIIFNHIDLSYAKSHSYSEIYRETLYFCRNCPYEEKAAEIEVNIRKLMDFCEQEISKKLANAEPFLAIIEEYCSHPDFSITMLADKCNMNVSYMSQLFKKQMNISFSDYLWTLRLNKAKELLRNTDMSIDAVSVAVGYVNTSSFRRKFKQETGLTPSQFREGRE